MIAPARLAAFDALAAVHAGRADLAGAVAAGRRHLLDERDRALMLELVAGTERMRAAIDYQLAARSSRPLQKLDAAVLDSLRLAAYQLLYLSRLPASAVINDAVDLVRRGGKSSAAGLVNAVLRALSRDKGALAWPAKPDETASPAGLARLVSHLATVHSHPEWLVARWLARFGPTDTEAWLRFNNEAAAMCLAANRARIDRDGLAALLAAAGVPTAPTARAPHGLLVRGGRPLDTDAFREGLFVVQDEASQLVAGLAPVRPGDRVLDLCAAPGGKTMSLAAEAGPTGLVVACDVRAARVRLLAETLGRCRPGRTAVVRVPAQGPLPFAAARFATVLVDAPCSGLGTLRRDPDIRWRRTAADLPALAAAQADLVARAAELVAPGGALVYATCSSEPEENDAIVEGFLAAHPAFSLRHRHETLPFRDGLEAFFGAVLLRAAV